MLNWKKIKYLDSGWKPNKSPSRDTTMKGLNKSFKWFKTEIEKMKKQLNKSLEGNAWVECQSYLSLLIRRAQKLYTEKMYYAQYFEDYKQDDGSERKCEHLIPLRVAVPAYLQNYISFEILLGLPTVDLSDESDSAYLKKEWKDKTPSWRLPFKRYQLAGIPERIYTSGGQIQIPFKKWTLKDHFDIYPPLKL